MFVATFNRINCDAKKKPQSSSTEYRQTKINNEWLKPTFPTQFNESKCISVAGPSAAIRCQFVYFLFVCVCNEIHFHRWLNLNKKRGTFGEKKATLARIKQQNCLSIRNENVAVFQLDIKIELFFFCFGKKVVFWYRFCQAIGRQNVFFSFTRKPDASFLFFLLPLRSRVTVSVSLSVSVSVCALFVYLHCAICTLQWNCFFFLLHLLCCIAWNACCKYAYARVKKKTLDARLYSVFFFCSRTHSIFRLLLSFGSFNRSICLLKIFTISID